jgi:hypothetical protein
MKRNYEDKREYKYCCAMPTDVSRDDIRRASMTDGHAQVRTWNWA